jgi:hypothetical protein
MAAQVALKEQMLSHPSRWLVTGAAGFFSSHLSLCR